MIERLSGVHKASPLIERLNSDAFGVNGHDVILKTLAASSIPLVRQDSQPYVPYPLSFTPKGQQPSVFRPRDCPVGFEWYDLEAAEQAVKENKGLARDELRKQVRSRRYLQMRATINLSPSDRAGQLPAS